MINTTMPTFVDGLPLTATEMNTLAAGQESANGLYSRWNFPFPAVEDGQPGVRYGIHRYRYLHWRAAATSQILTINGVSAGAVSQGTGGSGVIDLQHAYNYQAGANPYGLVSNTPYKISWPSTAIQSLSEHNHSNGALVLPNANDTFTTSQVPTAALLNNLARNTQYLLEHDTVLPSPGFKRRTVALLKNTPPDKSVNVNYDMRHRHRYLYVKATYQPTGHSGQNYAWECNIGGVKCFEHIQDGGASATYNFVIDMYDGSGSVKYGGSQGSLLSFPGVITRGNWYNIRIYAGSQTDYDGNSAFRLYLVAETPTNAQIPP